MRRFVLIVAGLVAFAMPARANGFTVAELFTSQSCSSCPPADALLSDLAKRPDVIALGCHVTYWDHLSWRDTLSLPACTDRQNDYNKTLDAGIFTPQLIINGAQSMVGSDAVKIRGLMLMKATAVYGLDITRDGGRISIAIPAVDNVGRADLLLVRYGDPVTLPIKAGENGGRTLTYVNPVLGMDRIGTWSPGRTVTVSLPRLAGHFVVLAQGLLPEKGSVMLPERAGQIVAAGRVDKP